MNLNKIQWTNKIRPYCSYVWIVCVFFVGLEQFGGLEIKDLTKFRVHEKSWIKGRN